MIIKRSNGFNRECQWLCVKGIMRYFGTKVPYMDSSYCTIPFVNFVRLRTYMRAHNEELPRPYDVFNASSPTRCFNTLITLQAIKGGSNRLTQVLGQYSNFCYRRLNVNLLVGLVHNACPFSAWHTPSELFYLLTQWRRTSHRVFQLML